MTLKAVHGNIDNGDWKWSDLDEARAYAQAILDAIPIALEQREAIRKACADGHAWSEGINSWRDGALFAALRIPDPPSEDKKITFYVCTRDGCEATKDEPGWIPFEPKTHHGIFDWVTQEDKDIECTGPGCTVCMYEQATTLPAIQITRGGIRFPTPPVDQATFEASTKTCEHSGDDFTAAGVCTICGWTDQP